MTKDTTELLMEIHERYNIPHDQKNKFLNDILDICATYERECREKVYEETPSEQVDRENFISLN